MATSYTDKVTDKAQDAVNGTRRMAGQAQNALSDIDVDQIKSQLKDVVAMADDFRRSRPALFWGAVAGVTALLAIVLFKPSKA
jgi:hypothetical protein